MAEMTSEDFENYLEQRYGIGTEKLDWIAARLLRWENRAEITASNKRFDAEVDAAEQRRKVGYRVVYGESRPAWEQIFPTMRAAKAFAKKHEGMGDIVFSIAKVVPGEPPRSMAAAIAASGMATEG
jgi:hypothetical protein